MTTKDTTVEQGVQTFQVDPSHSQVHFSVRHLGFSKVRGRFKKFSAAVRLDPDALDTLEAEATIQTASVDTGDEKRDAHLRSGDFFESETYPEMRFQSTGVRSVSGHDLEVAGELTIRGVTRPVVLEGTYLGEARDPWGGQRVAFEGKTKVNRKDFGLNWNAVLETGGFLVGDDVEIHLEIEAVRQEEA